MARDYNRYPPYLPGFKEKVVRYKLAGMTYAEVYRRFGPSRETVKRWVQQFQCAQGCTEPKRSVSTNGRVNGHINGHINGRRRFILEEIT